MPRGIFTQAICLLCSESISLAQLKRIHNAATELPVETPNPWLGKHSVILPYRPEVNGYVRIDLVDAPWPDQAASSDDAQLRLAYEEGWFGPYTEPGALTRALEQSWFWQEAKDMVPGHQAFVRIMASYQIDHPEGPYTPGNYSPAHEIAFMAKAAGNILKLPQVIGYFNPGGEVLQNYQIFRNSFKEAKEAAQLPLDAWTNLRIHNIQPINWQLLDVVGNVQIGLPDLEIWFPAGAYEINDAAGFLRDMAFHLFRHGAEELKNYERVKGPGDKEWKVATPHISFMQPKRQVLAFRPADLTEMPESLAEHGLM